MQKTFRQRNCYCGEYLEVRKFFPKNYTPAQMQAVILKLLDEYQRKRQRDLAR